MILSLVPYNDPVLSLPTHEVSDPLELKEFIENLRETLASLPSAIGLAAPQVGVQSAVFGMKVGTEAIAIFVNPRIIWTDSKIDVQREGCMSFPQTNVPVARPSKIKVIYQDELGNEHDEDLDGLACRVFLHEYQHLCGITILDHVTPDQKEKILLAQARRIKRQERRLKSSPNKSV